MLRLTIIQIEGMFSSMLYERIHVIALFILLLFLSLSCNKLELIDCVTCGDLITMFYLTSQPACLIVSPGLMTRTLLTRKN